MKIFLSWSGSTSHNVGLILRDWFQLVLPYVKPYVSSEDIDKGAKWLPDIVNELQSSYYGIILLTKDNINAPWLIFEAGVLTKSVERSRVSPLLFDLKPTDFSGPLTQFQCTQVDYADFRKLVNGINNAADPTERIAQENLNRIFDKWWGDLEQGFAKLRKESEQMLPEVKAPYTREQEMLEELLSLTRNLQMLLHTPETLLPEYYLESLFKEKIYASTKETAKIMNAVSQLVKNYRRIEQKISDYKGRAKEDTFTKELVSLIFSLKQPVELLSRLNTDR